MEFVLIPLLAIAAVTLCIYKLAELMFHIHLSCRLLILLVGFAWLISLVLPGLFFHSAGFLGSLGISLASALGFAWVAAAYDTRTQASRSISSAMGFNSFSTNAATVSFNILCSSFNVKSILISPLSFCKLIPFYIVTTTLIGFSIFSCRYFNAKLT